jgi:hypothetical protein
MLVRRVHDQGATNAYVATATLTPRQLWLAPERRLHIGRGYDSKKNITMTTEERIYCYLHQRFWVHVLRFLYRWLIISSSYVPTQRLKNADNSLFILWITRFIRSWQNWISLRLDLCVLLTFSALNRNIAVDSSCPPVAWQLWNPHVPFQLYSSLLGGVKSMQIWGLLSDKFCKFQVVYVSGNVRLTDMEI